MLRNPWEQQEHSCAHACHPCTCYARCAHVACIRACICAWCICTLTTFVHRVRTECIVTERSDGDGIVSICAVLGVELEFEIRFPVVLQKPKKHSGQSYSQTDLLFFRGIGAAFLFSGGRRAFFLLRRGRRADCFFWWKARRFVCRAVGTAVHVL